MTHEKNSEGKFSRLRTRAGEALGCKPADREDISALSAEEAQRLVHELRVHQIELQMQNEELRRTQEDLEESQHKYFELYEFAPLGYFVLDQKGVILEANLTGSAILGTARGFLIGKPLASFVSKEDGDDLYLHLRAVLETQSRQSCDIRLIKKEGNQIPLRLESLPVRGLDGSPSVFRTLVTDITRHKGAEEALLASENRYRRLFESARDGILILDLDTGKILDVNQYLIDMLGYSHEEFLDKYLWEISPLKDTPLNKSAFTELVEKGYIRYEDLPLETSDGRSINVEVVSNSHLVCGLTFIQCNIRDITERKKVEESLKETTAFLNTLLDAMPAPVFYKDTDGRYIGFNKSYEEFYGKTQQDLVGKSVFDIAPRELAEVYHAKDLELLRNPGIQIYDSQIKDARGAVHDVLFRKSTFSDSQGHVLGLIGVILDITERKKAEDAADRANQEWERTFNAFSDLVMVLDNQHKIVRANKAMADALGMTEQELIGKLCFELMHGEKAPPAFCPHCQLLTDGEAHSTEVAEPRLGGIYDVRVSPLVGRNGQIIGSVHITRDITERKMSENLIRIRLALLEYSATYSLDELLQKTLDEVGNLTNSPIGFYHFVESDQETLSLQAWSTQTAKEFCKAEGKGLHYRIDQAGVWVDCVHERKPVIHNDYSSLPHRKGMPEGHAAVIRELVVPIMRSDRIVAILGIGNKPTDYTEKDIEIVSYLADVAWEITEHKRTEKTLKERDIQYHTLFEESMDGVYSVLRDGTITDANSSFCELFGYTREEMIGKDIRELYLDPADRPRFQKEIEQNKFVKDYEIKFRKRDGTEVDCLIASSVHFGKDGGMAGCRGIVRDLTARKVLHKQLQQAQKMEAVGTLAGGIAHDFNNLLQVVLGYSELVLADEDLPDRLRDDLARVLLAARNGSDLVQRLLTFSRRTETKPLALDLNRRIRQTREFLQRTIPKMIDIELILAEDLAAIHVDPTQLDQVLMNLAVNARDAMTEGGKLVIKTENVLLDEDYARSHVETKPGRYVRLSVSDTGSGMDKETLEHIFEPFYTTKSPGQGTGLGLAMIFGIVKQHHGFINCYSEFGRGTEFRIYLPAVISERQCDRSVVDPMPQGGTETILLVDDEGLIRDLGKRILTRAGYTVLTAGNGIEALAIYRKEKGHIALVVLDLIMPEMGGRQCLEELLVIDSGVKVLVASGYAADGPTKDASGSGARGFIAKPFDMRQVLKMARKTIDED